MAAGDFAGSVSAGWCAKLLAAALSYDNLVPDMEYY
jgi:hypothetical protein